MATAGEKLTTFAVDLKGRVVAGVKGRNVSSLRIYDAGGTKLDEWPSPVAPEAINVRADGSVIVAGEGMLFDHGERVEALPEGQLVDALLALVRSGAAERA